jgi:hypothetical protein
MLNLCGIVVAILKMAAGRNFSMSGINSGQRLIVLAPFLIIIIIIIILLSFRAP